MRYLVISILGLLLVLTIVPIVASSTQQEVCERIVQTALEQANQVCTGTERNQACYGHMNLEAQPQSRLEPFKFDEAGDIVSVTQLKSLRLGPMNVATGSWGVAMMKLQANLSEDIPTQNVTLVLFGDVEIDNAIDAPTELDVIVSSSGNANIRREPSDSGFVLGTLPPGEIVTAIGRTADTSWVYIDFPYAAEHGWINRQLIDASGEIDDLNIVNPSLIEYGPMQAFYVRTGDDSSTCEEAPNDGLLIQTPEGAGEVRLWINEVKIRLGSTVYIQARPNEQMTISTLEGAAHVEAFGIEQTANAGMTVTIPMDSNSKPSAPPSVPEGYSEKTVNRLPVKNLEEQITIVPPVSPTLTPINAELTPTATSTSTAIPALTSTNTPTLTNTPIPSTETPTDVSTRVPTESPTQVLPTTDSGSTTTEEATHEVSQTQEPTRSGLPSETPVSIETPINNSRPTAERTNSDTSPTAEPTPNGNNTNPDV